MSWAPPSATIGCGRSLHICILSHGIQDKNRPVTSPISSQCGVLMLEEELVEDETNPRSCGETRFPPHFLFRDSSTFNHSNYIAFNWDLHICNIYDSLLFGSCPSNRDCYTYTIMDSIHCTGRDSVLSSSVCPHSQVALTIKDKSI